MHTHKLYANEHGIHAYWALLRQEPYRLLFPIGTMIGIVGVLLWPMFVFEWIGRYPAVPHARLMTQGFLFAFICGFLWTAIAPILEVPPITRRFSCTMAVLIVSVTILHLSHATVIADGLFLLLLIGLLVPVFARWPLRKDLPPPGFILALLGLLSAWIGTALLVWSNVVDLDPRLHRLATLLLYQGLPLLPILGISVFLMPRMLGIPNAHKFPTSPQPSRSWCRLSRLMASWGGLLIISFILEAYGAARMGYLLRASILLIAFTREVAYYRAPRLKGTVPWILSMALLSIVAGYLVMTLQPHMVLTHLHIVFMTGVALLTFGVATRVVWGHAGCTSLIYTPSFILSAVTGFIILAMATRISADFVPTMRWSHYAYAALTWAIASIVWLIGMLPKLAQKASVPES